MRKIYLLNNLPDTVHGVTARTDTGYIIVINANLPMADKAKAMRHEIAHITLNHFEQTNRPLRELEAEAEAW